MAKIRHSVSSRKSKINFKRLISAVPLGPFVPFNPGFLWLGMSNPTSTLFRTAEMAQNIVPDTDTYWGFVIQEHSINNFTNPFFNQSGSIPGKRIKMSNPNPNNAFEMAIADVEFEVFAENHGYMDTYNINIGFIVFNYFKISNVFNFHIIFTFIFIYHYQSIRKIFIFFLISN